MRLEAAITGNLHQFMEQQKAAAEAAVTLGVREITDRIKNDLRQQVSSAGLGAKLAKSWQSKFYPKGKNSLEAAGWVFSKAPKILQAFDEGTLIKAGAMFGGGARARGSKTIKGRDGLFLAIPTEAAPKRGVGGQRISPSNFPEHTLGRLRFVYRTNQVSLLVVDNLKASTSKRGGFRKASDSALKSGRGLTTVVMFFLVPQVKLKKRLDYKAVIHRWEPHIRQAILKHWPEGKGNNEQTRTNAISRVKQLGNDA